MQLGRMIDKALAERSAEYVREIYEGLRAICVASRDNKPIGDKMIMNAAFLLEREREASSMPRSIGLPANSAIA